jgi:tRNA-specific 2-thiouridylase
VTTGGEVLGEHQGFARYTVGQRRGLPGGRSEPLYVVDIRPDTREIVVGSAEELDAWSLTLEEVNWLVEPLGAGETCEVQVRSRAPAVPARVVARDEERVALELLEPARAVAPGQSGVLYREDLVLGGGVVA